MRDATKERHQRLESLYPFKYVTEPNLTPQIYADTLQILMLWHSEIEVAMGNNIPAPLSGLVSIHSQIEDLSADLDYMNELNASEQIRVTSAQNAFSSDQTIGGLYVLLGSVLGSRLIIGCLDRHNDTAPDSDKLPTAYYRANAELVKNWTRYISCLETNNDAWQAKRGSIIDGSVKAFDILIRLTLNHAQLSSEVAL